MEFQYRDGKPILPVQISGSAEKISLIGILDSGADYCTAPRAICEELLDTVREQEMFIPGGTSIDQITPADAAIALSIAAGGSALCDAATLAAADVSRDNRVTSLDALMILQAAAGNIGL